MAALDLPLDELLPVLVLVAVLLSFMVSASAGMGGSLVLVPTLVLLVGGREGVALAALLLAGNNVFKVVAYRAALPWRAAAAVVIFIALGAALGATALVNAPEAVVGAGVVAALVISLVAERRRWLRARHATAPLLAFGAGATSGFSGTSGPLKGAAIRHLDLDRAHYVGAASIASLVGDVTKVGVFARGGLLDGSSMLVLGAALPLMVIGTLLGRRLNARVGERGFAVLFWTVMTGYSVRLGFVL